MGMQAPGDTRGTEMDHVTFVMTRKEIALMQGALTLAMNTTEDLAAQAYNSAVIYPGRDAAYNARRHRYLKQRDDMLQLFNALIDKFGDIRKENEL
jgi:hypothetical protein